MALGGEHGKNAMLLVLRVGLGGMMAVVHGWPKLMGGPDRWARLGGAMEQLGITFAPEAWGLAAALAETVGGALLVLGLFTRPAAAVLVFTMFVAVVGDLRAEGLAAASHPIETGLGVLAVGVLGAGRWSLDAKLRGKS